VGFERKISSLSVTPPQGAELSTKPVWNINAPGADVASINVNLKAKSGGKNYELIKSGRFFLSCPYLDPTPQIGSLCGVKFTIGVGMELLPGDYSLFVEARDLDGNSLSQTWEYKIQSAAQGGGKP
jgi:hypothetical protein